MLVTQPPLITEMECETCQWRGLRQKEFIAKLEVADLSVNQWEAKDALSYTGILRLMGRLASPTSEVPR